MVVAMSSPTDSNVEKQELNMKVFCRVRPSHRGELLGGNHNAVTIDSDVKRVRVASKEYSFDRVFDQFTKNDDVYQVACKQHIEHAFNGFCATLMCYGQTGTGKTHTMSCASRQDEGILMKSVRSVFDRIAQNPRKKFQVRFNYVQLYRDNLQDLLNPDTPFLKFKRDDEDDIHTSVIRGVTWSPQLHSIEDFIRAYAAGDRHRVVAETKMNKQSSRGHSVLSLSITQLADQDATEARDVNGQLVFVDLAGYERMKKTMVEGVQKDEAKHINLSLSALAGVIHALTMGSPHIPWRNSKLTQLLKQSISGNSITSIILTLGPSSAHVAETINTLHFGHSALQCKTTVHVNFGELDYKKEYLSLSSAVKQLQKQLSETCEKLTVAEKQLTSRDNKSVDVVEETAAREEMAQRILELEEQNSLLQQQIMDADIIITETEGELEEWKEKYSLLKEKEERMQKASQDTLTVNQTTLMSDMQRAGLQTQMKPPPPPLNNSVSTATSLDSSTSAPTSTTASSISNSDTDSDDIGSSEASLLASDISFMSSSESEDDDVEMTLDETVPILPIRIPQELKWDSSDEESSRKKLLAAVRHPSRSTNMFISIPSLVSILTTSRNYFSQIIQAQSTAANLAPGRMQTPISSNALDVLDSNFPKVGSIAVSGIGVEGEILTASWEFVGGKRGDCSQNWIRYKTCGVLPEEEVTVVGSGPSYQVSTYDVGSILSFEVVPRRQDEVSGVPVTFRLPSIIQPCEPRVANLRIAGTPLLFSHLEAQYTFEGGEEGRPVIRWYKSFDGQRFVQLNAHSTDRTLHIGADLVHHYIRVQVTPIRSDGVKGNIVVSKLVYINIDESTDEKLLKCLIRGETSFSVTVLHVNEGAVVEGSECDATFTLSTEGLQLQSGNDRRHMNWHTGHPMITSATHLNLHPTLHSCIWWMDNEHQLLLNTFEPEQQSVIILLFRVFFCASRPEVVTEVLGELQDFEEDSIIKAFQEKKLDKLLTPHTDFRPGSHFTFLSQLEESLLRFEERVVGASNFNMSTAKLPVVVMSSHTVCF